MEKIAVDLYAEVLILAGEINERLDRFDAYPAALDIRATCEARISISVRAAREPIGDATASA